MDDLRLNRTVTETRSSGGGYRIFGLAIAIAIGLHLVVFGALALSAHNHKAAVTPPVPPLPSEPAISTPAPVPAADVAVPAASEEKATARGRAPRVILPKVSPKPRPQVVKPHHPAKPPPPPHTHVATARHAQPAVSAKRGATHRNPEAPAKAIKAKPARIKPAKTAAKRATKPAPQHAKAKPVPTLDLDALSKFKSPGK